MGVSAQVPDVGVSPAAVVAPAALGGEERLAPTVGVPSIRQATEQRSRRVESVRALAAIAVVQYHTMLLAIVGRHSYSHLDQTIAGWGIAPIYVFFALSGYLIFRPFARRDYGGGGPVDLRRYALNRVVRLLPIYYVAVVFLLLFEAHTGVGSGWWRFLVFAQTYSIHTVGKLNGPLWTLVVELQFYIALPFLAWAIAKLSRRAALRATLILAVIGGASFAYHVAVSNPGVHLLAHWSFPANFVFIVVGMIIGILETRWHQLPVDRLPRWLMSSGTWLLAGAALWPLAYRFGWGDSISLLASFLIVGAVILPLGPSAIVSVLDWRPLAALGIATYSLYIWHVPVIEELVSLHLLPFPFLVDAAVAVAVCGMIALLSYRFVEAPFLGLRKRWAQTTVEADVSASTVAT